MRSKTGINLAKEAIQAHADGKHEEAMELEVEASVYLDPVSRIETGAGNEALPQHTTGIEGHQALQIKDTLEKPFR
jgi:hypothetical protein